VAQLVEALYYKPEGHRLDSRWCHWNFSLTNSIRSQYGPGVDSASNRKEYEECFLGCVCVCVCVCMCFVMCGCVYVRVLLCVDVLVVCVLVFIAFSFIFSFMYIYTFYAFV
jgi:hypothetical protein